MKTFEITYFEKYANTYEIEADSREEAEAKFFDMLYKGQLDGPDNCYDSGIENIAEK